MANALDLSTCCFPTTAVDDGLDKAISEHVFHNHEDEALYNMCKPPITFKKYISSRLRIDNPSLFKYAPVGLQLMGKPQEEEAVIAMTEIVDDALKCFRQCT